MKTWFYAALLAGISTSALAADVGVSVSISQPGVYGRIDIGNVPQPQVIYAEPVVIYRAPVRREPIYLHVPPGHAKNWRKHCRRYDACGVPVYFVEERWYNDVYTPHYQQQERERHRHDQDEQGNRDDRDDRGKGHGKGHGKHH